jgi:hypothetical protein
MTDYAPFLKRLLPSALGHLTTLQNTVELTESCVRDHVPGVYVEAGVYAGVHPVIMAKVLKDHGSNATVHLFDSFKGIPHAGPHDDHTITDCIGPAKDGALVSSGVSVHTLAATEMFLERMGFRLPGPFRFHPGWFQHTVPACGIDAIALLRLDGDLYESTRVCLKYLGPKVSSGGYIVVDDYNLTGCRKAVDEFLDGRTPDIHDIGGPAYWRVE